MISRLVFLADPSGGEVGLRAAVQTAEALGRVPFLVVPPGQPAAELLERVTGFLAAAGDVATPPAPPTATPV